MKEFYSNGSDDSTEDSAFSQFQRLSGQASTIYIQKPMTQEVKRER